MSSCKATCVPCTGGHFELESDWSENVELFGLGGPYTRTSGTQLIFNAHVSWVAELITPVDVFGHLVTHVAQIGKRGSSRLFNYGSLLGGKLFVPFFDWIPVTGRGFPYFACLPD